MKLFTNDQKVQALNKIIKEISKCSEWELLDLMNYLTIPNDIDESKLPLVGRAL